MELAEERTAPPMSKEQAVDILTDVIDRLRSSVECLREEIKNDRD